MSQEELQRVNQAASTAKMKAVGDIQRSLLPAQVPNIPTLDIATHYHPSRRPGGCMTSSPSREANGASSSPTLAATARRPRS